MSSPRARILIRRQVLLAGSAAAWAAKTPWARPDLGGTAAARSAPDGYTLMLGSIVEYAIALHVHQALPFDPQRDFIPVVEAGFGSVALSKRKRDSPLWVQHY